MSREDEIRALSLKPAGNAEAEGSSERERRDGRGLVFVHAQTYGVPAL